jgi:hypothetical protein
MVPETESELFHVNEAGLAPEVVDPNPVPMVVQPAASMANSDNPSFTIGCVMLLLLIESDSAVTVGGRRLIGENFTLASQSAVSVSGVTHLVPWVRAQQLIRARNTARPCADFVRLSPAQVRT